MPWPKGRSPTAAMTAARVASLIANGKRRKPCRLIDGVAHWQCPDCVAWLPAEDFYADKRTPSGLKSNCRKCHTRTSIATRDPDTSRDSNREYMVRARKKNPEKFRNRERMASARRPRSIKTIARQKLNAAVVSGKLARPSICERCGSSARIHGHHHDYAKPLDVSWLCSKCHGMEHRA